MADRGTPEPGWPDKRLVTACLEGDELAWHALVDKYKSLVYSIAVKYRFGPDEAADVFQAVWLDAYNDLPNLRNRAALKPWLISLATHKCYHWKKKRRRHEAQEIEGVDPEILEQGAAEAPDFVEELERDQLVREGILRLNARCREMIRLLFFTAPPTPYQEVARRLGLATGSIGFIRGRCLQKLQKALEEQGLR